MTSAAVDRLALEHLTAPSASPLRIVELAAAHGWRAATVLVSPFGPFPRTASVDLVTDTGARTAVRRAAQRDGIALAMAYPFVLSRRTRAEALTPALDAAAGLGAHAAGLLVFDRDPARASDETAAFCELAMARGVRPVLEFFGGSAVPDLASADDLAASIGVGALGLCVDLLHLVRSGGAIADLATATAPILHAQLSDFPAVPPADRDAEATCGRLAPGDGAADLARFIEAVPDDAWLGVEVPPDPSRGVCDLDHAARVMVRTTEFLRRLANGLGVAKECPDRA